MSRVEGGTTCGGPIWERNDGSTYDRYSTRRAVEVRRPTNMIDKGRGVYGKVFYRHPT